MTMEGRDDKKRPANQNRKRLRRRKDSSCNGQQSRDEEFPGFVDVQEQRNRQPKRQRQDSGHVSKTQKGGRRRNRKKARQDSDQFAPRNQHAVSTAKGPSSESQTLHWHVVYPHVPVEAEKLVLKALLRWKDKERGMMRNAGNRYKEIQTICKQCGMQLSQALSLRRQHIQMMNPFRPMASLGLGKSEDIRESAAVFETCVERFMRQCKIQFLTESEQKARLGKGLPSPPTPDFMLCEPTLLSSAIMSSAVEKAVVREHVIHWIEVKMFYGASTVANDDKSAVGRILSTASKYVKEYSTGAMVFMYGCGEEMAQGLLQLGVVALDAHPVDLRPVEKHQRTWCANENGLILP